MSFNSWQHKNTCFFIILQKGVIEFEAVTVAFAHHRLTVPPGHHRVGGENGVVGAEAHRAALVGHLALVVHQVDDRVPGRRIELGRVGLDEAEDVAGVLDRHGVQSEAQAETGQPLLPCVACRGDLALETAGAEATGDDEPVEVRETSGC